MGGRYSLLDVFLDHVAFDRFRGRGLDETGEIRVPETKYTIAARIDYQECSILVQALLEMGEEVADAGGGDEPDDALHVTAAAMGVFSWTEPVDFPPADFARWNAPALMWPFLRETVWSLTVRSDGQPLLLPLVNFGNAEVTIEEVGKPEPELARAIYAILRTRVPADDPRISYSDLVALFPTEFADVRYFGDPRLPSALAEIGVACHAHDPRLPALSSIVVNATGDDQGYPGKGYYPVTHPEATDRESQLAAWGAEYELARKTTYPKDINPVLG